MDKSLDEILKDNQPKKHDSSRKGPRRGSFRKGTSYSDDPENGYTIMISNLFYTLNEDDLQGLFGEIGPISRIKIHYDRSGRSEGVAWITYREKQDAREAIDRFNGKKAAGQEIGIRWARGYFFQRNELQNRIAKDDRRARGGNMRGSGLRGRIRRGGVRREGDKREVRHKKTAEELDQELDKYMSGVSGSAEKQESGPSNEPGRAPENTDIDMVVE